MTEMVDYRMSIFHLDDDPQWRASLQCLTPRISQCFADFYREHFVRRDPGPSFRVEVVGVATADELRDRLFVSRSRQEGQFPPKEWRLTEEGARCVAFVLDYFIGEGRTIDDSGGAATNGMDIHGWLSTLFPAIPRIILTSYEAHAVAGPAGQSCDYWSKDDLQNPDAFLARLRGCFTRWWSPEFSNSLRRYVSHGPMSWHTPGHNRGHAFKRSPFQADFYQENGAAVFATDLSVSVPELGDLSEPNEDSPLTRSQVRAADVFGAASTTFVTNGTSTTNKALLMALLREGEVVFVDRNCHKSVHQAIVAAGALPVYLPTAYNSTLGVWSPVELSTLKRYLATELRDDLRPRVLVLTTCTYEGALYPVRSIARLCSAMGIAFYADEAWAPHLRFSPCYVTTTGPLGTGEVVRVNATDAGAHFVAHSTHKVLAAFSQASMAHVTNAFVEILDGEEPQWAWLHDRFAAAGAGSRSRRFIAQLHEAMRYWHTTSPQYPMLATLDRAAPQMRLEGMRRLGQLLDAVGNFTDDVETLTRGRRCVARLEDLVGPRRSRTYMDDGYVKDPLKLLLIARDGAIEELRTLLRGEQIRWEKSSQRAIELVVSAGTFEGHFQRLYSVLRRRPELLGLDDREEVKLDESLGGIQILIMPRVAMQSNGEMVPVAAAIGRVSAQLVVPYPPGIPIVVPGAVFSSEAVARIRSVLDENGEVHGLFVPVLGGDRFVRVMRKADVEAALASPTSTRLAELASRLA